MPYRKQCSSTDNKTLSIVYYAEAAHNVKEHKINDININK